MNGPGADEPLLWYEGAALATRRGLFANHQGSIVAVADANGASVGINAYDAYGVPNSNNMGRFQYTGQAWIAELGLYHYKARLYSPTLGRFLQTDPIGYEDSINLYGYVGNDPLNSTDPTGMAESCTGSRLNSGCEFVNGSDARNAVMNRSDRSSVATQPLAASGYEDPTFSEAFNEHAADMFEPLTEAADNAVDYWVEQGGRVGCRLWHVGRHGG